jgi:hypothetical protein
MKPVADRRCVFRVELTIPVLKSPPSRMAQPVLLSMEQQG